MTIDLHKGPGVWFCHGDCKRGGSLRGLALEMGWVESETGAVRIDCLPPPYEYEPLEPGETMELRVLRWEVGLSRRPIEGELVTKETIRFYVPTDDKPERPAYYDFTNLTLIIQTLDIYREMIDEALRRPVVESIEVLEATSPERARPLTLRLKRRGRGLDTRYDVRVVAPKLKDGIGRRLLRLLRLS